MDKSYLVSFVIPCYNSTKTIPIVVEEIIETMRTKMCQYDYEIILVNDCSPDGTTYSVIKALGNENPRIKGVNLARNFGQPSAVMAALTIAKGDFIVCGDDDGQTPFNELPRLFEKIDEGYDVVEAKYVQREKRSLLRKIGTHMNQVMATWLINKPREIALTSYWVIRRYVRNEMVKYPNSYPYIGGLMLRTTQNVCNVEVAQRNRFSGKSGYNIRKMLELWLNGFTSFSVKPLRLVTVCGMVLSIVGLLAGVIVTVRKICNPSILAGYSSTMAVILFLFGILFMILGMLGEYIGRIYIALNNAPQFVIRDTINIEKDNER